MPWFLNVHNQFWIFENTSWSYKILWPPWFGWAHQLPISHLRVNALVMLCLNGRCGSRWLFWMFQSKAWVRSAGNTQHLGCGIWGCSRARIGSIDQSARGWGAEEDWSWATSSFILSGMGPWVTWRLQPASVNDTWFPLLLLIAQRTLCVLWLSRSSWTAQIPGSWPISEQTNPLGDLLAASQPED